MTKFSITRRHGLFALAAAPFAAAPQARAENETAGGLIVLTIGGLAGASNRAPFDPARDRFFDHNNLSFKNARAFNAADLARLPQRTVTAEVYWGTVSAKGAVLKDVIAAAAPSNTTKIARFYALDGYGADIALGDIQSQDWILASELDGAPLAIGQLGPLYALRQLPPGEKKTEEEGDKWVHSLYYIDLLP